MSEESKQNSTSRFFKKKHMHGSNAWHESWNCHKNNSRGILLSTMLNKKGFYIQSSDHPTRLAFGKSKVDTYVDLYIGNRKTQFQNIRTVPPPPNNYSDHEGIICELKWHRLLSKKFTNEKSGILSQQIMKNINNHL